jgi:hypothetical protein
MDKVIRTTLITTGIVVAATLAAPLVPQLFDSQAASKQTPLMTSPTANPHQQPTAPASPHPSGPNIISISPLFRRAAALLWRAIGCVTQW